MNMCKTTYSPVGRNGRIPDHANMLVHCQMVAKGFGRHGNKKSTRVLLEMLQNPRSKLAAWSEMHKDTLAVSHFEGDFGQHFISFPDFFMTEYASLSNYLSKNVQVVIQVVNNQKVMAKTPREANLYGNWCVRKYGVNWKTVTCLPLGSNFDNF